MDHIPSIAKYENKNRKNNTHSGNKLVPQHYKTIIPPIMIGTKRVQNDVSTTGLVNN